ncbi:MAG: ABC transporter permease, partial [Candidatus Dadabacteria bacterium]
MIENLLELFRFRALISALVVRHLAARYRGSFLGYLWSLLNPLCLMLVYMLVFKYYIRFTSVEHYSIFLFVGLLPWIWLSNSLLEGANSIVANGSLVTKSMFPAQALPTVSVLTGLVHFLLSLPVLFLIMVIQGVHIPFTVIYLPLLVLLQVFLLYGLALVVSA